jgi:hypothetical protein
VRTVFFRFGLFTSALLTAEAIALFALGAFNPVDGSDWFLPFLVLAVLGGFLFGGLGGIYLKWGHSHLCRRSPEFALRWRKSYDRWAATRLFAWLIMISREGQNIDG